MSTHHYIRGSNRVACSRTPEGTADTLSGVQCSLEWDRVDCHLCLDKAPEPTRPIMGWPLCVALCVFFASVATTAVFMTQWMR